VSWIDLQTTGTVLFVVGLVGLALAVTYTFWSSSRRDDYDRNEATRRPPPGI
jgi:hypothetical protein